MSHDHNHNGGSDEIDSDTDGLVKEEEDEVEEEEEAAAVDPGDKDEEEEEEEEDSNYALCRYCDDEANLMAACHICGEDEYCMVCNPECMICANHICVQCMRFENGGGFCAECHETDGYYCQDCVVIYFGDDKRCCKRHALRGDKNEV